MLGTFLSSQLKWIACKFTPLVSLLKTMNITEVVSTAMFILYLNKIRELKGCTISDFYTTIPF